MRVSRLLLVTLRDVPAEAEITVEVLNSPSTATQQILGSILEELRLIRTHLEAGGASPSDLSARLDQQDRPAA